MTISVTQDAVVRAMEQLARRGKRVFYFNVLEETRQIVGQEIGGELLDSMFWEAVDSLVENGTIEGSRELRSDWRVLDRGRVNLDQLAEEAVRETIETLCGSQTAANRHTVPDTAAQLLFRRAAAGIDIGQATELVNNAVTTLEAAERIECPALPNQWRIVR